MRKREGGAQVSSRFARMLREEEEGLWVREAVGKLVGWWIQLRYECKDGGFRSMVRYNEEVLNVPLIAWEGR